LRIGCEFSAGKFYYCSCFDIKNEIVFYRFYMRLPMFGRMTTVAFEGVEARAVDVQAFMAPGLHNFTVVGLPDKAVAESRERVRAALAALGMALPPKRIIVNLAPADLPKEGTHYDLPIALALLLACGVLPSPVLEGYCAIGELGLDGGICHVAGGLPAAIGCSAMNKALICPESCGPEAAWASPDLNIAAAPHLLTLINHFKGLTVLPKPEAKFENQAPVIPDIRDVRGQETAKRALEIAAAGGHHMVMIGPPGAGKTMLAQRLPGLLPQLEPKEILEVAMIHSMAGALPNGALPRTRPFRSPHHSASMAALVGGGIRPKPGEVSLAHRGVLFLDELPEFSPQALDALRQPLEMGETVIARANHRISYPSRIQLVAAMNPCRCGYAGSPGHSCKLGPRCAESYQARISGPLWDRLDIRLHLSAVRASDLALPPDKEGSKEAAERVSQARRKQQSRYKAICGAQFMSNADCPAGVLDNIAEPDRQGRMLLEQAADIHRLSARGYHRILRVARTIADLDDSEKVSRKHLAEAMTLRLEKKPVLQAA
jgi:magnesium chelatase family protein